MSTIDLHKFENIDDTVLAPKLISINDSTLVAYIKLRISTYKASKGTSLLIDQIYWLLDNPSNKEVLESDIVNILLKEHKPRVLEVVELMQNLSYKPNFVSKYQQRLEHLYELLVELELSQCNHTEDKEIMSLLCDPI
jgi:hypothetical protein